MIFIIREEIVEIVNKDIRIIFSELVKNIFLKVKD